MLMKNYRIYQVDAFTKSLFKGNPAGVVANADGLSDSQMQSIARELNNAETAFILSPTAADHDVWLRFFTPTTEVPICGHATVSAHYVRAIEQQLDSCVIMQRTGAGVLPVEIVRQNSDYTVIMTQAQIEISDPVSEEIHKHIMKALGLSLEQHDERCPIQIVSTGHSKVMVGINSRSALNQLQPNMLELVNISQKIACNGYFVFTLDSDESDILTHGRMFAPAIGIAEDPVTGNAHGPLGAYLVHHSLLNVQGDSVTFKGKQGEAINRAGRVTVTVDVAAGLPQKVNIQGQARIAFQTSIKL